MLKRMLLPLYLGLLTLFCSFSADANTNTSFANRPEVQSFIHEMVKKHHFSQVELNLLFNKVKIRPKVIQTVKSPAEHRQPWYLYQMLLVTESRIRQGLTFWDHHAKALARAEKTYGVPASIIVATIGIETKYGKIKGDYPVIDALSNIAFSDSSRAPFFRYELEEFLLLTREQHLNPLTIKGSYAGAIGQPQFMPSSYRRYAINFSGNSKIDLSNNEEDVIGSIANYYQKHGWRLNQLVIIPTVLSKDTTGRAAMDNTQKTISETSLTQYGIYPAVPLPADQKIKVIQLQGYRGNEYWLALHNFDVIKRYNASDLYAMAVYELSYYIAELRGRLHHV